MIADVTPRVGGGKRDRQVRELHPGVFGERDELLDDVEAPLVGEVLQTHAAAVRVGLLALAVAAGEHALGERAPHERSHSVALGDGKDLPFDAAVEDRVGRLFGVKALEAPAAQRPTVPRRSPRPRSTRNRWRGPCRRG